MSGQDPIAARFVDLEADTGNGTFLDGDAHLSFSELTQQVSATARLFEDAGIGIGDRVVIACAAQCQAAVLMLACIRAGALAIVTDARATAVEHQAILERAKPKALFADADIISALDGPQLCWPVNASGHGLKARLFGEDATDRSHTYPDCLSLVTLSPAAPAVLPDDAPAIVLTTSGTTGQPKLVPHSREFLVSQSETICRALDINPADRVMNLMHPSHIDGAITGVFLSFWRGSTMVAPSSFTIPDLPRILDLVHDCNATHLLCVPTVLNLAMRFYGPIGPVFNSPNFRMVISTAAPIFPRLWEQFESESGKAVVNVYGLSETGNLFFTQPQIETPRTASIGHPHDCEACIVDDNGELVADGSHGELLLRSPVIMRAYLGEDPLPEWFATGDVAIRHTDGHYDVLGRKKNVAIVGGRNVQLEEVEAALLESPAVREAAAVGLEDEAWGERVVAAVVAAGAAIDLAALRVRLAGRLSEYKIPRTIVEVAELPTGRSGKVRRAELEKLFSDTGPILVQPARLDLLDRILQCAAASFGTEADKLRVHDAPGDTPGWDSMAHLDLVVRIEDEFDVEFDTDDILAIDSLASAVQIVERLLRA